MRKLLLAVVALGGLTAIGVSGAMAQLYEGHPYEGRPSVSVPHAAPERPRVAYYEHDHHRYHHRQWDHGHWRYWD
jgi:hypothetical protein